jgi:hypothetical protein
MSLTTSRGISLESPRESTITVDQAIVEAMASEIHKTAQPLTLLRGLLEMMLARVSNTEDRRSLEQAMEATHRVTTCFSDVRKLIGLKRPARDVVSVQLSPLVTDVLQNLARDLDIARVSVLFDGRPNVDGNGIWVNVSQSRVCFAIRFVLTALVDCLGAGDQIQVCTDTDGSHAQIKLWASKRRAKAALEHGNLGSMLGPQIQSVQVLLASTGAEVCLDESQDIVILSLPMAASYLTTPDGPRKAMHV